MDVYFLAEVYPQEHRKHIRLRLSRGISRVRILFVRPGTTGFATHFYLKIFYL
ncbi:hypothetical protein J6590_071476 [Homalodisca vitripennis]|nr:hypothetical protein J6590_071476 [Homalodisca vitripennis]